MKNVICFSIVLLALAGFVCGSDEKVVVCYVGTWATYRQGLGKFDVENIESELCTHLVYTFVGLANDSSVVSLDPWLDLNATEGGGRDNFRLFNTLKTNNTNLKTLLAVGGYNEGSAKYSQMAADPVRRETFISSALSMVLEYGFNGLDLDWEYPNQRDSVNGEADVENLTTLLKELKAVFENNGLLVTIAVASVEQSASLSYDVVGVSSNVDFIHLMTYDLHGAWDSVTGHNAGLYKSESELSLPAGTEFTVDAAVQYWLNQGCPSEKLVLGMPLYGRTFTLSSADSNGVGAPSNGAGIAGPYTVTAGIIAYNEFCDLLQTQTWNVTYDDLARVPYAVQNLNWVTYDNPNSLAEKVDYALKYNLAGAVVWSLESDDFNEVCGERNALLRSINRALGRIDGTSTTSTTTSSASTTTESITTPSTEETSTSESTPTTEESNSTVSPTTEESNSTVSPTTEESNSTVSPTTEESTSTVSPTTEEPTPNTSSSTEESTSTVSPTTEESNSTVSPTTEESSSTVSPTTEESTSTVSSTTEESTSTVSPTTEESTSTVSSTTEDSSSPICTSDKLTANPKDCGSFYYCVRNIEGTFDPVLFKCPANLYWDQSIQSCNYAYLVYCSV